VPVFPRKYCGRSRLSMSALAGGSPFVYKIDMLQQEKVYHKCELHSFAGTGLTWTQVPVSQGAPIVRMQFAKLWDPCDPLVRGKPSNGRQIAGMSALRVICRLGRDEPVHCGQRRGVVCFGFRARVYRLQGAGLAAVETNKLSERKQ
jgi:hypothetical protein